MPIGGPPDGRPPKPVLSAPSDGMKIMNNRAQHWTGRTAFAVGLVLAAGVLAAGRVPGGEQPLKGSLTMTASATGGLAASPEGRFLSTRELAPRAPAVSGRVGLLNQTSDPVTVLVRATGTDTDLDRFVRVELRPGSGRPLSTTLKRLRRWRTLDGSLASQRRERVNVSAWIPGSVTDGYQARRAAITLEFLREGAES